MFERIKPKIWVLVALLFELFVLIASFWYFPILWYIIFGDFPGETVYISKLIALHYLLLHFFVLYHLFMELMMEDQQKSSTT